MKKFAIGCGGFVVVLLALAIGIFVYGKNVYNNLVNLEENVNQSWSQVENNYQRRADLIPNLVKTVKGYASHEKETLEGVIKARSQATATNINANDLNAEQLQQFQAKQDALSSALSRLMVVIEKYPDLKANENFRDLQVQLEGTENRIAVARKTFNEQAQAFNKDVRRFPNNIFANFLGFDKKPYFKAEAGSNVAPVVDFD